MRLRPSRLFKSNIEYILRSTLVIIRVFMIYKPFNFNIIYLFNFRTDIRNTMDICMVR